MLVVLCFFFWKKKVCMFFMILNSFSLSSLTNWNVASVLYLLNYERFYFLCCFFCLFQVINTFGGYAACIFMGLIFVVFMPIIGCIYCCCHCCCNKCGGTKEKNDPKHAKCKKWTYTIILLVSTSFLL